MLIETPIETERLLLRSETPADGQAIYTMNTDPEVMRFVGAAWTSPVDEFLTQHRTVLIKIAAEKYGNASVILKHTNQYIGWCGLIPQAHLDGELELGYRYYRHAWGKGHATEAARAVLSVGFERIGKPQIFAMTRPENTASIRVLEKLGFHYLRDEYHPKAKCNARLYVIEKAE